LRDRNADSHAYGYTNSDTYADFNANSHGHVYSYADGDAHTDGDAYRYCLAYMHARLVPCADRLFGYSRAAH